jgi:hypothetical protein
MMDQPIVSRFVVRKDAIGGGGEKIVSIVADVNRWSPPQCKRRMT